MRKKRLFYNTLSSLTFRFASIICGFILPRLIIKSYGSEINGLVNSILQFLNIITFLELGVGAVVRSSLYRPLAEKNMNDISKIAVSSERFYRKIAFTLIIYVILLIVLYPLIINPNYGWFNTAFLIIAISISSFAQYYFGISNKLLLMADQKGYFVDIVQTITLLLNTVACVVLILNGSSIQLVKLTTSCFFLFRPLLYYIYVNNHYKVNRKIKYDVEPITQKWNGVAQHISAIILDSTDIIVLTLFSSLSNVSIYSVYYLVIYGVIQLILSITNGMQPLLGELWAKSESYKLNKTFSNFEWFIHFGTIFTFGCTGVLILPFVQIYTSGLSDVNYTQPLFALIIVIAHAINCLRLPYNILIFAGGHYKQTQRSHLVAAVINVSVSVVTVMFFDLIGVAIGTLIAMTYHAIWIAFYVTKKMIKIPLTDFAKQISVDLITVIVSVFLSKFITLQKMNYFGWSLYAIKIMSIWILVGIIINLIIYRNKFAILLSVN